MSDLQVKAETRTELGKNSSRRLRRAGMIPVVIYGRNMNSVALSVDPRDLIHVLESEHGQNTIFKINYGKNAEDVLIRDIQIDPVRGTLMHADLQKVAMDQTMVFEIPIVTVGLAPGVEQGGVLDQVLREIEVECLPGDVPEEFKIDVSQLEIGDALRVVDLKEIPESIEILTEKEVVLVAVSAPTIEEEEVEEEEVEEPELIPRGKTEEEEPEKEE